MSFLIDFIASDQNVNTDGRIHISTPAIVIIMDNRLVVPELGHNDENSADERKGQHESDDHFFCGKPFVHLKLQQLQLPLDLFSLHFLKNPHLPEFSIISRRYMDVTMAHA
jgi:hypothetical protein